MEKKFYTVLLIILSIFVVQGNENSSAEGKKLEEIISRHIEAHGGYENWSMVDALELNGHFTGFSERLKFYMIKTQSGKIYKDYHLGKNRILEGFDGNVFWTIDPWLGFDFPRKINAAERHVFMQKAELFSPFYRWKERNFSVELHENEFVDGMEMYVLSLTRPGMTTEKWYLNAETFLVHKSVTRWVDFATPAEAETFYDDYREVNGLILPHFIENTYSTRHTIIEIDEVTVNPLIDDKIFSMPPCPHMEKLTRMAGTWDVQVEYMTRAGTWRIFDNVEGAFDYIPGNMLQGNISYEITFPVISTYTINYSRRKQEYQLTVFDEFYSTVVLYKGTLAEGILVFENQDIVTGEMTGAQPQPVMQVSFDLNDGNSIVMKRKRSEDHGKTWQDIERLTFTRSLSQSN